MTGIKGFPTLDSLFKHLSANNRIILTCDNVLCLSWVGIIISELKHGDIINTETMKYRLDKENKRLILVEQ